MSMTIERIAGPGDVASSKVRVEDMIRRCLEKFVTNTHSRLVEMGSEGRWAGQLLLITAKALEHLPGFAQWNTLLAHVHEGVKDVLTGVEKGMLRGLRALLAAPETIGAADFVASIIGMNDPRSRAALTFCYERRQLLFLRTDDVSLVRNGPTLEFVLDEHGAFRAGI